MRSRPSTAAGLRESATVWTVQARPPMAPARPRVAPAPRSSRTKAGQAPRPGLRAGRRLALIAPRQRAGRRTGELQTTDESTTAGACGNYSRWKLRIAAAPLGDGADLRNDG